MGPVLVLLAAAALTAADAPVAARLVADVAAVEPGTPFTLGVEFACGADWHLYWRNPGEAGLAPDVRLELPPGWTAGPWRWPVPERVDAPGGIAMNVLHGTFAIAAEVVPPADAAPAATLRATVRWLQCRAELCEPGQAALALELPRAAADADAVARWRASLPVPLADVGAIERADVEPAAAGAQRVDLVVRWSAAVAGPTLFPPPGVALTGLERHDADGATRWTFTAAVEPGVAPEPFLVAWADAAGARRGAELPVPLRPTTEP